MPRSNVWRRRIMLSGGSHRSNNPGTCCTHMQGPCAVVTRKLIENDGVKRLMPNRDNHIDDLGKQKQISQVQTHERPHHQRNDGLVSVSPQERCHNHTAQEQPHQVCLANSCRILDAGNLFEEGFQGFHNAVKRVASTADTVHGTPLSWSSRTSRKKEADSQRERTKNAQGNAT